MVFFNTNDMKHETVEGDVERYIYTGDSMQVVEYVFPPNKSFPEHKHDDHEQMGRLIKGKMAFVIEGEERILYPGDFYHVRRGVMHGSRTFEEESVLLDIFTPPRDDLK